MIVNKSTNICKKYNPAMKKPFFPITLKLVFHRRDHICCLGRRNLITQIHRPKFIARAFPPNVHIQC